METLKNLFVSKKFIASLGAVLFAVLNDVFHKPVSQEIIYSCLGLVAMFVGAQGLADMGKEKEKIANEARKEIAADVKDAMIQSILEQHKS